MCKLIARNHVSASLVLTASKYKIALLSTSRSTMEALVLFKDTRVTKDPTIPVHDTCWLRQRLHTQYCPQVDLTTRIPPIARVSTEHKQVVTQDPNQTSRRLLRREALYLHIRAVAHAIYNRKADGDLPHDTRKQ